MTTPASNVPTSGGQGGTGGGVTPPATTKDTEAVPGGEQPGSAPAPATQPDTTTASGANTGNNPLYASPAYRAPAPDGGTPAGAITDTTVGGGNIGATAQPAYRAPANDVSVTGEKDTTTQAGQVAAGTDPRYGGGVNPAAAEPGQYGSGATVAGTRDTSSFGGSPLSTVPDGGAALAPTGVTATLIPNRSAVTVAWTPPSNAVAANVLTYVIESNTTGTLRVGKEATTAEFEQGLIPGQTYTFTVYAETSAGQGVRSAPSSPVTVPSHLNLAADVTRDEGL